MAGRQKHEGDFTLYVTKHFDFEFQILNLLNARNCKLTITSNISVKGREEGQGKSRRWIKEQVKKYILL